jgi:hypothetical protein
VPQSTAAAHSATFSASLEMGYLCLFGFEDGEVVRYEVRDAAGQLVVADEGTPDNMDGDPLPSVKVMMSIAESAPGTWTITALGGKDTVSGEFEVRPLTLDGEPAVILVLAGTSEPKAVGEQVGVAAYGLPAGGWAGVGVYEVVSEEMNESQLRLHESTTLEVDEAGAANATLTLDPSYKAGKYCVVVAAGAAYEPARDLSTQGAVRCFEVMK